MKKPAMSREEFRDHIERLGWSYREAAKQLGISQRTAIYYARGRHTNDGRSGEISTTVAHLLRIRSARSRRKA